MRRVVGASIAVVTSPATFAPPLVTRSAVPDQRPVGSVEPELHEPAGAGGV